MRKHISSWLFLAVFAVSGCKSTSTSTNGSPTIVTPGEGSYFLIYHENRDSNGVLLNSETDTETVYLTNLPLFGKTNVMELITRRPELTPASVEYVNYESNGDVTSDSSVNPQGAISIVEGGDIIGEVTYPFASQTTKNYSLDTTLDGHSEQIKFSVTGSGSGTTPINGQAVPTQKVTATVIIIDSGITYNFGTVILSFAPSLGVIVEKTILQGVAQTYHEIVTNYALKP